MDFDASTTPARSRGRRSGGDPAKVGLAVRARAGEGARIGYAPGLMLFVVLGLLGVLVTACGSGSSRAATSRSHDRPSPATASASGTLSPSTTTSTVAPTTTAPPQTTTTVPPTTVPPPSTTSPPTTAASPVVGAAASSGGQIIKVMASGYGVTTATFEAYQRTSQGAWELVYGPWQADIGYNGMAPPGQKKEGDGRTPSGTYGFDFFFGDLPEASGINPGWSFRQATSSDYWDDDPSSPSYNQWVDEATQGVAAAGANPEPMYDEPAYDYGAVIAYNQDPVVPGAGSAIFLHVSTGGPTAGCVSLPESELLEVLRWLDPTQQPQIQMGVQ